MRSRAGVVALGVVAGAAAGWWLSQRRLSRHREDLFSPRPLQRLGALGYLAGDVSVTTVRLLQDYVKWEREPRLRRRGEAVLRRVENALDGAATT